MSDFSDMFESTGQFVKLLFYAGMTLVCTIAFLSLIIVIFSEVSK